jgi:RNA polymerase sigma factor (sigma-70 family)
MSTPIDHEKTKEAFRQEVEALYLANRAMVLQTAYWTLRNKVDAEDVLQTVFQKLLQLENPEPAFLKNPKGYLYRAAVNEALDVIESRKREDGPDDSADAARALEADLDAALDSDRLHDILCVRSAMEEVHPRYAELLRLYYSEGYDCLEIAKLQNKYPHSIFMGLTRARSALKKAIVKQEKERETQKDDHQRGRGGFPTETFGRRGRGGGETGLEADRGRDGETERPDGLPLSLR